MLAALGAGTNDVLAAFLGSVCSAFLLTKPTARTVIATVFIGTCVGTYFGPNAMMVIGKQPSNALTFIIGSVGTVALGLAGTWVKSKLFGDGTA